MTPNLRWVLSLGILAGSAMPGLGADPQDQKLSLVRLAARRAFDQLDTDKDGALTRDELKDVHKSVLHELNHLRGKVIGAKLPFPEVPETRLTWDGEAVLTLDQFTEIFLAETYSQDVELRKPHNKSDKSLALHVTQAVKQKNDDVKGSSDKKAGKDEKADKDEKDRKEDKADQKERERKKEEEREQAELRRQRQEQAARAQAQAQPDLQPALPNPPFAGNPASGKSPGTSGGSVTRRVERGEDPVREPGRSAQGSIPRQIASREHREQEKREADKREIRREPEKRETRREPEKREVRKEPERREKQERREPERRETRSAGDARQADSLKDQGKAARAEAAKGGRR